MQIWDFKVDKLNLSLTAANCLVKAHVTAVTRDVTHALARSLDALRVSKSMCSVDVVLYGNSFCRDSF